jgi:hypothetical protein
MARIDLTIFEGGIPGKVDIDAVIAYQRKQRANAESGVKTKRGSNEKSSAISLDQLGMAPVAPKVAVKRRF